MSYGKLGIDFFSTSELLYPNMKIRLRLITARLNFYMELEPTSVLELWIAHFTLVVLLSRMIITKREWTCSPMLLWNTIIWRPWQRHSSKLRDKTNSFKKTISTMLPFVESRLQLAQTLPLLIFFNENPFWYQQFDLAQIRILRKGQPIVDFDTAEKCRLYVTTMKALNFQDDIPSIPIDEFKDHYVLVFDLTWMQDATKNCHYPELLGEPLRLELNFNNPLENVTELIVLGEQMSSVEVDKFGVVGKNVSKWIVLLCNKLLNVFLCSSFGTSVRSPQTMCQLLIMTLLLLSTRNPAICRVNIGSWLQISDMNCVLQTLLDVTGTVSWSSTTSRWCQHPYSLTQVYAAFTQYLQLFISSSFSNKKLQEFTILMYSLL